MFNFKIQKVLIGIICIVVLTAVVGAKMVMLSKPAAVESVVGKSVFDLSEDKNAADGTITGKAKEEVEKELNERVADGMINISMNSNPVFEDNLSEGNLLIVNNEVNKYPQVVEIYLEDTNELIYKSGGVGVGKKIETAKLSKQLDKGVYNCIAYFNAVDSKTNQLVGKAASKITITILN